MEFRRGRPRSTPLEQSIRFVFQLIRRVHEPGPYVALGPLAASTTRFLRDQGRHTTERLDSLTVSACRAASDNWDAHQVEQLALDVVFPALEILRIPQR
jgi:hypothetical protein